MVATERELEGEVKRLRKENAELKERIRRLEELLAGKAQAKVGQVQKVVDVYPSDVAHKECVYRGRQFAWRFIDGRAVYVQYDVHAPPGAKTPTPPGVRNRRGEYGVEIIFSLAFLHYWIGLSIDNARMVMGYFTLHSAQSIDELSPVGRHA